MIRKIGMYFVTALFGVLLLSFPAFLNYLNPNTMTFNLALFLNDYPVFRFVIGILLIVIGLGGFAYLFILSKYKTIYVIQESSDGDFGSPDLHYPLLIKGDSDEIVYTNLATLNNHSKDIIELEKKRIRLFYEKLPKQKKIAFLGIATIPSLVYAGYVVGENGRKIKYYHWNREKQKAKRLCGIKQSCVLSIDESINSINKSKEYVIYVSVSYLPNKEQVKKQFGDINYIFCQTNKLGVDVVKTGKDLSEIANNVRKVVSNINVPGATVHLILQCSAELCFAIGQKLNTTSIPNIKVYSFNFKNELNPWDWYLELD